MFAVVQTGGKQYKVAQGDVIRVEKLDVEAGKKVQLQSVMMVSDGKALKIGAPFVAGAEVEAEVIAQDRNEKVIIFKKKRRHNYRRKNGHKQHVTVLRVTGIKA